MWSAWRFSLVNVKTNEWLELQFLYYTFMHMIVEIWHMFSSHLNCDACFDYHARRGHQVYAKVGIRVNSQRLQYMLEHVSVRGSGYMKTYEVSLRGL